MKRSDADLVDLLLQTPAGLTAEDARAVMLLVLGGSLPEVRVGVVLATLQQRPVTAQERAGFVRALRETASPGMPVARDLVHVCGVRGGKCRTFLAGPAAAFVAAAAGVPVIFHGDGQADAVGTSELAVFHAWGAKDLGLVAFTLLQAVGVSTMTVAEAHRPLGALLRLPLPQSCSRMLYELWRLSLPAGAATLFGVTTRAEGETWAAAQQAATRAGSDRSRLLLVQEWEGSSDLMPIWPVATTALADGGTRVLHEGLHGLGLEAAAVSALPALPPAETAEMSRRILQGKARSAVHADAVVLTAALYIHAVRPQESLQACVESAREHLASGVAWSQFEQMQSWLGALPKEAARSEPVAGLRVGTGS